MNFYLGKDSVPKNTNHKQQELKSRVQVKHNSPYKYLHSFQLTHSFAITQNLWKLAADKKQTLALPRTLEIRYWICGFGPDICKYQQVQPVM